MNNSTSIKFVGQLSYEETKKKIEERIEECYYNYDLVNKILPILKEHTGKKITKHIVNDINKKTGLNLRYVFEYGMYYIKDEYNKSNFSLLIGYDSRPMLEEPERLEYYAMCYILEKERGDAKTKGLEVLKARIEQFNACIENLKAINKEMEQYGLEYTFDITNNDLY